MCVRTYALLQAGDCGWHSYIMQMIIFLEDLNDEAINRIRWALRYDLQNEIAEAVKNGVDPDTADEEILNDYMNRNNRGASLEL